MNDPRQKSECPSCGFPLEPDRHTECPKCETSIRASSLFGLLEVDVALMKQLAEQTGGTFTKDRQNQGAHLIWFNG